MRLRSALSDRYTIERELGQGGMATVYLAHDVRHDRKVALKVLKPELAAVVGAERFLAEIRTTANLQHPHILPLFDSGEADGFLYFVMPYVEGESLRGRLDREKHLPIDEAIRIATEVADALEHAHSHGVIHRDIKPANILLRDGHVQVADFGIALAVQQAGGARLTETGLSVGTPHYMSPEQASGDRQLDGRSDVYSLGCVLYEMLAGEPPHTGPTAQSILSKILTDEPRPVGELRRSVPAHVAAAVRVALEKLPADRIGTAAGFAAALREPSFASSLAPGAGRVSRSDRRWQFTALAALLVAAVAVTYALRVLVQRDRDRGPATYDVVLPDTAPMRLNRSAGFSVSPDADFVIYVAERKDTTELWYRSLVDATVRPVPGTIGAVDPVVSPDGRQIAFYADGLVKTIPVEGGAAIAVAELAVPMDAVGPRWTSPTQLVIIARDGRQHRRIDVGSGTEETAERVNPCILPALLPNRVELLCGGGGDLYANVQNPLGTRVVHIEGAAEGDGVTTLLRGSDFEIVGGDVIAYTSMAGELRVARIDLATLRVGRSVAMVSGIRREAYTGVGHWAVSDNGTLVYAHGDNADVGRLVRVEPGKAASPLPIEPAAFLRYDMTPDGRKLAAVVAGFRQEELRVYDLAAGRAHTWLSAHSIGEPMWTPEGDTLLVTLRDRRGFPTTIAGSPTASAAPDTILSGTLFTPLTYNGPNKIVGAAWPYAAILDRSASPATIDTLFSPVGFIALSPDNRWLAFQPGTRAQVIVSPFPSLEERHIVAEGVEPQWRSPNELLFWRCCWGWFSVRVGPDGPMGNVQPWHTDDRFADTPGHSYTVTGDGAIVYLQSDPRESATYLRVVPGWVAKVRRAVQ